MGNAARKLDAWRPETADPAVVVDLAKYKHRRSRAACRLASGSTSFGYEVASEHGLYRYSAFGKTKQDTTTLVQQLRWKARWQYMLNGAELYDVRARQWAPEIGAFISIDEFKMHDPKWTLWSWPHQNPIRFSDPDGRGPTIQFICTMLVPHPYNTYICFPDPTIPNNDNDRVPHQTLEEYCVEVGERAREQCERRKASQGMCPTEEGLLECIGEGVEAYEECKRPKVGSAP